MATEVEKLTLEKDFQQTVIQHAVLLGWLVGFTFDSRKSRSGEPDLRMVHPKQHRTIFMELKSERGTLTKGRPNARGVWQTGQDEWADALNDCPGTEYYLFRPSDWDQIVEVLNAP